MTRQRNPSATRSTRHSRVPIVRQQIRGLRDAAQRSAELVSLDPKTDDIGHVLAANMNAGFALELGLKLFSMTYADTVPRGHELKKLYDNLPEQIRSDIALTYATGIENVLVPIKSFAFQISSTPPSTPTGPVGSGSGWATAEKLFETADRTFEQARYFYEEIKSDQWISIDHPVRYLIAMIDTLDVVYEAYRKAGGWGDQQFPNT